MQSIAVEFRKPYEFENLYLDPKKWLRNFKADERQLGVFLDSSLHKEIQHFYWKLEKLEERGQMRKEWNFCQFYSLKKWIVFFAHLKYFKEQYLFFYGWIQSTVILLMLENYL